MIRVREYACLTTKDVEHPTLDIAHIDAKTFTWLSKFVMTGKKGICSLTDTSTIKLASFVGYLETPGGIGIEILPKTKLGEEDPELSKQVLRRMLSAVLGVKYKEVEQASLLRSRQPIHEWVLLQFLTSLKLLMASGLRGEYARVDEVSPFIRGQLDVSKQQRQPPGKSHLLHIRHDVFSFDRIENRLIKTALDYTAQYGKTSEVWRLANELSHRIQDIESFIDPVKYLPKWGTGKLMQSYQAIKPWCALIIERLNPEFQKSSHRGIALLFPMETLFEAYVGERLKQHLISPWRIRFQASSKYLLQHKSTGAEDSSSWFQLKPDFLLYQGDELQVADAKWKLLDKDNDDSSGKYGLSQSDMYQMFAYGHKYQSATGHMMLIYPKHDGFLQPLPLFSFSDELKLWVVPCCIETGELVMGDWLMFFPAAKRSGKLNLAT
jgi:5-methylcytosine-specific restriction enzyme subunit McrC